jgi:hypothetical protein
MMSAEILDVLQTISVSATNRGLSFLLAGGHAVLAHGHLGNAFGLDLIVRDEDRDPWSGLADELGYRPRHEGPNFLQFDPAPASLPLDLMFIHGETFAKLVAQADPFPPLRAEVKVVSLRHLLALKCHAIKHGHAGRVMNDAADVIQLVTANGIDMDISEIIDQFMKDGTAGLKESKEFARCADSSDLDLPDWSGMTESTSRMSVEAAIELSEQYMKMFPEACRRRRRQPPEKCTVEFVL